MSVGSPEIRSAGTPDQADLFAPEPAAFAPSGSRRVLLAPPEIEVEVSFSPCGLYRHEMTHRWAPGGLLLFGMMNPSDAGRRLGNRWTTDTTVAKVDRIARRLGFGGSLIANACGRIATHSAALGSFEDAVGPRNAAAISAMAARAAMVVVAHGRLPQHLRPHAARMCDALAAAGHVLHVLRLTPDGIPMHPLARGRNFIPEDVVPCVWDRHASPAPAVPLP